MKNMMLFNFILLFCCVSCVSDPYQKQIFSKNLMYTRFDIVIYSSLPRYKLEKEINKIWDELSYWYVQLAPEENGSLNLLNNQSFLSKNDDPKAYGIISNFIEQSKIIALQSDGAFDLTVYPLIKLWGIYQQDDFRVPADKEIKRVLTHIGMDKIHISNEGIYLEPGVQLDFGAIAKGFAVDRAVSMLTNISGVNAGFVNAGGNLLIFGSKPDHTEWSVGIRNPNGGPVSEIIPMYDNEAIATSGDYEQFFIVDNKYYHHIFNPKTGYPVDHNLASVSVIIKGSAELADIYATTFLSLGKKETLQLVSNLGLQDEVSLFFIERQKHELSTWANQAWMNRYSN
ncbi:thiamine biosynthesis lipoprotein [Brevinema andersonii]|uniref:FAD:protein FMN transferase n=1 Tax=Brevinema andersonii TaxID=34097 RepID=A0A1I1EQ90_BREAD|nr:FAD:protein FMN transferase [Brevinema andersonii]SFB89339.1 thiamine biosynthesis lipoprotein [Brevinema andersonii]